MCTIYNMDCGPGMTFMKLAGFTSAFIDADGGQSHSCLATSGMKCRAHSLGAFHISDGHKNTSDTVNASRTFPPTTTLPNGKQPDEAFWRAECAHLKEELQRERAERTRVAMLYVKAEDARKVLEAQLMDLQAIEDTKSAPPSHTPLGAWTQGSSYVLAGGDDAIGATFDDAVSQVESLEFVTPIASGSSTPCVSTPMEAPTPRVPTPRAASPVQPSPRTRNVYTMSRHECPQSPLLQLSVIELRALAHAVMNPARNANAHSLRPPSSRMSSKKLLTPTALGVSGMSWE
eukprot:GEMP01036258.1.p1 GENE.GEMP01036258.1~~GEMP01036258.1.p1  ORF type:complete len:289 (+),score=83.79 GEMP01036258.1:77-943(+)